MTKIIGAALTAISVALYGYSRYVKYTGRPKELDTFISLLTGYKLELGWRRRSLKEMIGDFAPDGCKEYFARVGELLVSRPPLEAFIDENDAFSKLHLNNEDVTVLRHFFSDCGKGSAANELTLCEKTLAVLSELRADAEAERKKLAPLAIKLAVLCGVWIVILLI